MNSPEPFLVSTRPEEKSRETSTFPCFQVINIPVTIIKRKSTAEIMAEISSLNYDCIVFTSSIGSSIFMEFLKARLVESPAVAYCIGEETARPLREAGIKTAVPERKDSIGLSHLIASSESKGSKILLLRSAQGNPYIREELEYQGFKVHDIHAYGAEMFHNQMMDGIISSEGLKGIIFTSSMEVEAFLRFHPHQVLTKVEAYAIGESTSQTLNLHGIKTAEPKGESDFSKLVHQIAEKHCSISGEWI